ncbi:endothelin-2 [Engraulis encrasicolus]|uniref:endothelin-2 n=1 Tax=Engraulis encrasicolus TaxID=184585 RepID=UPI002FD212F1
MASLDVSTFLVLLCAALQTGLGAPVSAAPEGGDTEQNAPHIRTKRCSCSNQLDSECHYFCHLDIIWVNTPSKTTVYGLGSALSRRRRSVERCTCAHPSDHTCSRFCRYSTENPAIVLALPWAAEEEKAQTGVRANERASLPPHTGPSTNDKAPLAFDHAGLANEKPHSELNAAAQTNDRAPLAAQKALDRARSDALALIRELIHADSLEVVERPYPPGKKSPSPRPQKPAYR